MPTGLLQRPGLSVNEKVETTVLLVEDNAPLRELLSGALQSAGFRVVEAADGTEAITLLQETRPDIVVTDIFMPETEGLEVVMATRKHFPDARILAMSGGGQRGYTGFLPMAEKLGADRVMEKPFRVAAFIKAIRELS